MSIYKKNKCEVQNVAKHIKVIYNLVLETFFFLENCFRKRCPMGHYH